MKPTLVLLLTAAFVIFRLPARAENWPASMVLAGGHLYASTQGGDTFVLQASPKFEVVSVNPLGEISNSSLAVSEGDIFIRTHQSLWCVGGNARK